MYEHPWHELGHRDDKQIPKVALRHIHAQGWVTESESIVQAGVITGSPRDRGKSELVWRQQTPGRKGVESKNKLGVVTQQGGLIPRRAGPSRCKGCSV